MKVVPRRWLLFGLALSVALAGGRPTAAQPTSRPAATQPAAQIRNWFVGMADADAGVRNRSRDELLGLKRADLPALRAIAAEFAPLEPNLGEDLREIVTHVYLASERFETDPMGFLGIKMPPAAEGAGVQVIIQSRMPGFVGYRVLRDGDVLSEIEERPLAKPLERSEFVDAIRTMRPGQMIHLKVLRRGEMIRIAVALDARPADNSGGNPMVYEQEVAELLNRRSAAAEAYWAKNFQALVDGKPSLTENRGQAGG